MQLRPYLKRDCNRIWLNRRDELLADLLRRRMSAKTQLNEFRIVEMGCTKTGVSVQPARNGRLSYTPRGGTKR